MSRSRAQDIIRAFYLLTGTYTLAVALVWGVSVLFFLEAGLSVLEVFVVSAAFTASTVLFEVPTGVFADNVGRRRSILIGVALMAMASGGYVLVGRTGGGVLAFASVAGVMGLGFSFYSGAGEAWLVDGLADVGWDGELDRVFTGSQLISGGAMLTGTLGGGFLGQVDLALPYVLQAIFLFVGFMFTTRWIHDIGFTATGSGWRDLPRAVTTFSKEGIGFVWRERPMRFITTASFLQTAFVAWGLFAWQPYFLELLDSDAVWVAGVVSALVAAATMVGNGVVEWFTRVCRRRTTLLIWAGTVQAAAAVAVGLATSFTTALFSLLVMAGSIGASGPVRQAYLHRLIPRRQRTTVTSLDFMVCCIGATGGQIGLGAVADSQSFTSGYVVGGLLSSLAVPLLLATSRLHTAADHVVGAVCRAGQSGSCAARGLPAMSQVDSGRSRALV
jgi:MFS family permease